MIEGHHIQNRNLIVQIATPYNFGMGFYFTNEAVILTNEYVVRDCREVIVEAINFPKQSLSVLYVDAVLNLAFIEAPKLSGAPIDLLQFIPASISTHDKVTILADQQDQNGHAVEGEITYVANEKRLEDVHRHNIVLPSWYSGSPLFAQNGAFLGVNTFLPADGETTGFTLPAIFVKSAWESYAPRFGEIGVRCDSCHEVVFEKEVKNPSCSNCGQALVFPSAILPYEANGVAKTIEEILKKSNHQVALSRRGPSQWLITEGSAKVHISYHERSGLITGDAYLCELPQENPKAIYEFLLRLNYEVEGLTFSVKGKDIILSLLIYDQYLDVEVDVELFNHLFIKADYYDNILVEEFGGKWKLVPLSS